MTVHFAQLQDVQELLPDGLALLCHQGELLKTLKGQFIEVLALSHSQSQYCLHTLQSPQ